METLLPKDGETYREFIGRIAVSPEWEWTAKYWLGGCIIACFDDGTPKGDVIEVKNAGDKVVPKNIRCLGCSGFDKYGVYWVAWDLDVGHGANPYDSFDEALKDAMRLRDSLGVGNGVGSIPGEAEIRRSRSGNGLQVRHLLPIDAVDQNGEALDRKDMCTIAKGMSALLGMKDDTIVQGRQAVWLWVRDGDKFLGEHSFEVVAEQEKPVLD